VASRGSPCDSTALVVTAWHCSSCVFLLLCLALSTLSQKSATVWTGLYISDHVMSDKLQCKKSAEHWKITSHCNCCNTDVMLLIICATEWRWRCKKSQVVPQHQLGWFVCKKNRGNDCFVKPRPHCTLATIVAVFGDKLSPFPMIVAFFDDYSRQCGRVLTLSLMDS